MFADMFAFQIAIVKSSGLHTHANGCIKKLQLVYKLRFCVLFSVFGRTPLNLQVLSADIFTSKYLLNATNKTSLITCGKEKPFCDMHKGHNFPYYDVCL